MDLGQHDWVPLLAVMSSSMTMTYHDHEALIYALRLLSGPSRLPERIRERSYLLAALGFMPTSKDVRVSVGMLLLSKSRVFESYLRAGVNMPNNEPRDSDELPQSLLQHAISTIVTLPWMPWTVPQEHQLAKLRELFNEPSSKTWRDFEKNFPALRDNTSAASEAIRFLCSLQREQPLRLRRIILNEDRKSVARPETHAHGILLLIEGFCNLGIERRVDLWKNV